MQLEFSYRSKVITSLLSAEMCMVLSMMSVAEVILEKLTVVSRRYCAEVQTIPAKLLGTLTLMCDHSPQHTNSNRRNVVYVCCSVLTI